MSTGWDSSQVKEAKSMISGRLGIYLCIQHMLVRQALKSLLDSFGDLQITGVGNSLQVLMNLPDSSADVCVVEADIIKADFERTLKTLTRKNAVVLILQKDLPPEFLRLSMKAGVRGYVCNSSSVDTLYSAIKAASENQVYLDPSLVDSLVEIVKQTDSIKAKIEEKKKSVRKKADWPLSSREAEILKLVARGYKGSEIAERLGISVKTVDTHRARAMNKLGLHSRAEVFEYGMKAGWINSN